MFVYFLFTFSAVCLHLSAICVHFQLFVYICQLFVYITGLGHLMCFRHPKLLHVVHGAEETSETLAFASEPLIGSLANILNNGSGGSLDHGEQKSNQTNNSNSSLLKIDYNFIDVEYRYGFSQVKKVQKKK